MKMTIIVKEEHINMLHKADTGEIDTTDDTFKIDWSLYSNYVKGYITVQVNYDLYVKLQDASIIDNTESK